MDGSADNVRWIAVDWGTSHLRAWLMGRAGQVLEHLQSGDGMAGLSRDAFEPALLALTGPYLPTQGHIPVICCGMAGSRQGWAEAPYATVPHVPSTAMRATRVTTQDNRLDVHILPGLKQDNPADVMRGEETQIAGFLAGEPDFDGVICLPGTHCKWVQVSAGEVVSFRTFMTGELFALLSEHSVLRHSMAGNGWDQAAFDAAVSDALSKPETVAARLFSLRAEALLSGLSPERARARLSGLLIGLELGGARPYWLGQQVAILGAGGISAAYEAALAAQSVPARRVDADASTLRGLNAAYDMLKEQV